MTLGLAVRDPGSSRHLLLPPFWRIEPTVPLSAAAVIVQVKEVDADAPSPSVAVTFTL